MTRASLTCVGSSVTPATALPGWTGSVPHEVVMATGTGGGAVAPAAPAAKAMPSTRTNERARTVRPALTARLMADPPRDRETEGEPYEHLDRRDEVGKPRVIAVAIQLSRY